MRRIITVDNFHLQVIFPLLFYRCMTMISSLLSDDNFYSQVMFLLLLYMHKLSRLLSIYIATSLF